LGYFEDYPDYRTQGESLEDLQQQLNDFSGDLTSGEIPGIRKVAELIVSCSGGSWSEKSNNWAPSWSGMAGGKTGTGDRRPGGLRRFPVIARSKGTSFSRF
jgi:hypothetical protein